MVIEELFANAVLVSHMLDEAGVAANGFATLEGVIEEAGLVGIRWADFEEPSNVLAATTPEI